MRSEPSGVWGRNPQRSLGSLSVSRRDVVVVEQAAQVALESGSQFTATFDLLEVGENGSGARPALDLSDQALHTRKRRATSPKPAGDGSRQSRWGPLVARHLYRSHRDTHLARSRFLTRTRRVQGRREPTAKRLRCATRPMLTPRLAPSAAVALRPWPEGSGPRHYPFAPGNVEM